MSLEKHKLRHNFVICDDGSDPSVALQLPRPRLTGKAIIVGLIPHIDTTLHILSSVQFLNPFPIEEALICRYYCPNLLQIMTRRLFFAKWLFYANTTDVQRLEWWLVFCAVVLKIEGDILSARDKKNTSVAPFTNMGYQLPVPYQYGGMIKMVNTCLWFCWNI